MKTFTSLLLALIGLQTFSQAKFECPDTVFTNEPVTINNTSASDISWDWNFQSANLLDTPNVVNLGINDPAAVTSLKIATARDGNNYYAFFTNIGGSGKPATITRLKFKGSFSNTPEVTNLGNLGGYLYFPIGMDLAYDSVSAKWFGVVCNSKGNMSAEFEGHLTRLDFGSSLDNIPITTIVDSTKGQSIFPHNVKLIKDQNKNWWCFLSNTGNFLTGTGMVDYFISRYYFGNSLANSPVLSKITETDLGKPLPSPVGTMMNRPCSFQVIKNEWGDWYGIVLNQNNNSFTKIYFGKSLGATKATGLTGQNIGKIAGLSTPQDFHLTAEGNKCYAAIINGNAGFFVALFDSLGENPKSFSFGNIATGSGLSELFRKKDTIVCFAVDGNAVVYRISYTGKGGKTSSLKTPTQISYDKPGTYTIRLTINGNDSIPSYSYYKTIVVVNKPPVDTTALNDINIENNIYPNPAQDHIRIKNISSEASIRISSINGTLMYSEKVHENQISLQGFAPGIYFVEVADGKRIVRYKFVKE